VTSTAAAAVSRPSGYDTLDGRRVHFMGAGGIGVSALMELAHARGAIVKVIIETALLTDEEKTIACLLAKEAGADFVKTSTGFAGGGATVHDVELMRRVVGPEMGVKASGGVRTYEDAEKMLRAGATRIGASAGVKIIQGPGKEPSPAEPAPAAAKSY